MEKFNAVTNVLMIVFWLAAGVWFINDLYGALNRSITKVDALDIDALNQSINEIKALDIDALNLSIYAWNRSIKEVDALNECVARIEEQDEEDEEYGEFRIR